MINEPGIGDFGLTQIAGAGGAVVRVGQWMLGDGFSEFEHAFVYVGNGSVIEAEPGGARIRSLAEYETFTVQWSSEKIQLTDAQRAAVVDSANGLLGTPYSFLDYCALAAHRLGLKPLDALIKGRVESSRHLICSQLVDRIYADAGVHLFNDGRWPGYVTPGDLYGLLNGRESVPAV